MKNLGFLIFFFLISCQDMRSALVLSDGTTYIFEEHNQKEFDSFMDKNVKGKRLLLYVTGRGVEPMRTKLLIAPYVEKNYDVQLFTFRWPSWAGVTGYPKENAATASLQLKTCLEKFDSYMKRRGIHSSLLVHSMGNIVLQNFLHRYKGTLSDELFDSVILSAADADFIGHREWIKKINFTHNLYVTFNSCDWVLRLSQIFKNNGRERLGQKGYIPNSPATYIDFSANGYYHEYFWVSPFVNFKIKRFFHEAFHGEPISTYDLDQKVENYYIVF